MEYTTKITNLTENPQQVLTEELNSDKILLFIIGNSPEAQDGAVKADQLASTPTVGYVRWVIWITDHNTLQDEVKSILEYSGHNDPYDTVIAFCLSKPERKARTIVYQGEALDYVQLLALYTEAEAHSN